MKRLGDEKKIFLATVFLPVYTYSDSVFEAISKIPTSGHS